MEKNIAAFVEYKGYAFGTTAELMAASWDKPKKGNGIRQCEVIGAKPASVEGNGAVTTGGRGKGVDLKYVPTYIYVQVEGEAQWRFVHTHQDLTGERACGVIVEDGAKIWVGDAAKEKIAAWKADLEAKAAAEAAAQDAPAADPAGAEQVEAATAELIGPPAPVAKAKRKGARSAK